MEYADRSYTNQNLEPIWRPLPFRALQEMDFRFDQYHYRIDGIKYIIHNREFREMAEREIIWASLSGQR